MDTREKILPLDALNPHLAADRWIAVAGAFDPLTLEQAERISALKRSYPGARLLAIVSPDRKTLLPFEARAALVAALREVDAVVIADAGQIALPGLTVEFDAAAEKRRSSDFVKFVLARQGMGT